MAGYITKWLPPPTIDDYMWEVQQNIWWQEKERAKRQLLWIMERYLGENHENEEEAALCEVPSSKGEEGKDVGGVECH